MQHTRFFLQYLLRAYAVHIAFLVFGLHAFALHFLHFLQPQGFAGTPGFGNAAGDGVIGELLQGKHQLPEGLLITMECLKGRDAEFAGGKGTRFVEHHLADVAEQLHPLHIGVEDATPGCPAQAHSYGCGCGQSHGTGTGNHQHRHTAHQAFGHSMLAQ